MLLDLRLQIAFEDVTVALAFAGEVDLFEFRQRLHAEPALELKFVFRSLRIVKRDDVVPVSESALGLIFHEILPCPKRVAGVVPRIVDDHPHVAAVHLADQFQEQLVRRRPLPRGGVDRVLGVDDRGVAGWIRAKRPVDVPVVAGIVFVQRRRVVERIEINGVDAEILQVVEFVEHPLQVATEAPRGGELVKMFPLDLRPFLLL